MSTATIFQTLDFLPGASSQVGRLDYFVDFYQVTFRAGGQAGGSNL